MGACCCAASDQGTEVKVEAPQSTAPGIPETDDRKPEEPPSSQQDKEFTITIDKGDDPSAKIGLDITRNDEGTPCLKIKKVKAGHIMKWNEDHPPDQSVQPDDLIIQVNSESGSTE